mmetsp:Transcript_10825/g.26473  ORF Transcript_10825/g.26473 Transcript_10825/m.26473 type:complete len:326 (-) Transcript_10825:326-1303(-)|eukprot:CAMPEP_0114509654 /NCGR_PEP_ID=MMETSP0109-20121206/13333_1 /TAXON_ID=29199 /ORGANISM="Chlorarachnion reptans, Strain CCCM449" /LENGTH=325 /DNA_ID=CAMNT_0001688837 /DNA_START=149 /DNA_END=1126 /DNA_ORIENTATION=-
MGNCCGRLPARIQVKGDGDASGGRVVKKGEAPEEADDDGLWYFAIGSMTNPVSLAGRGLNPLESVAARILDFKLEFFGTQGFAGAFPEQGKSFFGVLHRMDQKEMAVLDKIEAVYNRVPCTCIRCDNGKTIADCYVYQVDPKKRPDGGAINNPPTERYVEIIVEGCTHFGVPEEHIKWLRALDSQKRILVEEGVELKENQRMLRPNVLNNEIISRLPVWKLADFDAKDENEKKKYLIFRDYNDLRVILKFKDEEKLSLRSTFFLSHAGGKDLCFVYAHLAYDPKYGMPKTEDDISSLHRKQIEATLRHENMLEKEGIVAIARLEL